MTQALKDRLREKRHGPGDKQYEVCTLASPYPGHWFLVTFSTTSPGPLSSPVYFTGLVPAAIFPIGGAIPALILGERMVRGGRKRRSSPLHTPCFDFLPLIPTPALPYKATLLSSRSSACIQMGLLSPGKIKGAVTSLPHRPLLVGVDTELGSEEGVRDTQEGPGLGFVE